MATKVTMWCDFCPTLLEIEAFEVEFNSRQILPRQDNNYDRRRVLCCGLCFDRIQGVLRPIQTQVLVTAEIVPPPLASKRKKN